ncbi:DNA polymerase sliding clamp [Candidatus Bathyarchaeota archaeon]|nr:MAG: DNA polymerase sliding clamp [Candidatus Bathyarchaeota archaeon]
MSFRLKVASAREFKNALNAIATLVDEGVFVIDPEGLKLRAMDPSKTAMVDFMWGRSVFDEYEAPEEGVKLCVNIDELLKLLRKAAKGESLELGLDEATGRVKMALRGRYVKRFTIPRLETVWEEVPGELKIPFNAKIAFVSDEFKRAITDAALVADFVKFSADSEKLVLTAEGDVSSATIEFPRTCDAIVDYEVKEPSTATFDTGMLEKMVRAGSALADVVVAEFSTDKPMKLAFRLPYEGKLIFYLAPRVEAE